MLAWNICHRGMKAAMPRKSDRRETGRVRRPAGSVIQEEIKENKVDL